jgi:hypothetical protein
MRSVAALVLLAVTLSSSSAFAEDEPQDQPRVWYGWQNLGTDALALGLVGLAVSDGTSEHQSNVLALGAAGVYLLGSPLVHAANGNGARGLNSFLLRAGLPLGSALVAYGVTAAIDDCSSEDDDWCELGPVMFGAFGAAVGAGVAVLVDDLGLSYKEAPRARSWTPVAGPAPGGGLSFGLAGTW